MALFHFPSQVNERAARLVAAAVAVLLGLAGLLNLPLLVPVMAVGFLLRAGWGPRFSPLARVGSAVAARLGEPLPVPGAPKRFAQGIGAGCTGVASVLFATGHRAPGWALVGLVALFAALEASVAFC